MVRRFNDWLGDRLAFWLSTMAMFYFISAFILIPLAFQRPTDLVGWIQYIVQSFFQGAALPVLGYVARMAGEKQEAIMNETHDAVMEELALMREELIIAKEERASLQSLVQELHTLHFSQSANASLPQVEPMQERPRETSESKDQP